MAQREYGGMYPEQKINNILKNAQTYDWVRDTQDAVVKAAEPWLAKSDEELWTMIPGQELPRTIDVTWDYDFPDNPKLGCLKCGDAITPHGNYPYTPDFENKPWKLTCPSCGVVFPTNDFGKYYKSGIDEHGLFDPDKADKSLLFNTAHPDPSDPLHKYGVDDGNGYVDKNGREHKFIGYYAWKYWRHIYSGLQKLSDAYLYTGDKQYARKAAIILDRIADVYPAMDWAPYAARGWYHSDGSSREGKIEGRIWETATIQHFARAYDKIISGTVDNPQLYTFLQQKAEQYDLPGDKGTRADLISNIDKGILETAAEAVMSGRIQGNEGMHQSSIACCAIALDTEPKTSQWLDWLYEEDGGHLPRLMVQLFDRDGMASEAAPGYCYLWPGKLKEIMNILEPYEAYTNHRISRDYPFFRNAYRAPWRVQLLNTFTPNIGDSSSVGKIGLGVRPSLIATGFEFFDDPVAAYYAWQANGKSANGLLMDVGSTTPDALNLQLRNAVDNFTPSPHYGENMAGYGLASFEFGNNANGKGLWMYYGRNGGHGHLDRLNYGIYAFHTDLTPEMAYPEFMNSTWMKRKAWTMNTLSHNTVTVDKKPQSETWVGYPQFYNASPGFGVAEVESRNVYPQCPQYARTIAFIQAPADKNAYAVDVFRVTGGKDHLFSFHGPPGSVTATGLNLTAQSGGSYAGADVEWKDDSTAYPLGYSYLKNVERDSAPAASFQLDWKTKAGYRGTTTSDNIHMRLHVVSDIDDVALADGEPPQNKEGNPKLVRYALLHNAAAAGSSSVNSQFVTVAEPWKDQPFIENVTRLDIGDESMDEAVALKIQLAGGVTDYIISNPKRRAVQVIGGPSTDGAYAWLRVQDGKITSATLTHGSILTMGETNMSGTGNIAGSLVKFEKNLKKPATAWVKFSEGDPSKILGSQIIFDNDGERNACYDIKKVERDGELWKITCGPGTFARGFVDPKDYSKGYIYNIREGSKFVVPVTTVYHNPDAGESNVTTWNEFAGNETQAVIAKK